MRTEMEETMKIVFRVLFSFAPTREGAEILVLGPPTMLAFPFSRILL
jgi:hypothetical protein